MPDNIGPSNPAKLLSTKPTSMRAATPKNRIYDFFNDLYEGVAKQPLGQIADKFGLTDFGGIVNDFSTPKPKEERLSRMMAGAPEMVMGTLGAQPKVNLGGILPRAETRVASGPIAQSVANDIKVPPKPPMGPDAESLAEIAENEAMLKRILGESAPAPAAPVVTTPPAFNKADEAKRLIEQLTGKPVSAVPKMTNVDLDTVKFKDNASGDKGGMAGSFEETSALTGGGRQRVIDRGTGVVPLLSGRDIYPSAGQKVGWRDADGNITWDSVEKVRPSTNADGTKRRAY